MGIYEPWLRAGGVLALANIRGGDEFGEKWHKGGMLANKQNCFDDFISAAEFLISEKITSPEKLAIIGGSNGGLLTGACMIQRPDLFAAVVSDVPLLDMIRFPKHLLAYRWTHEYGDPEKPDEFSWLYAYSPYHHIDPQKRYPAVLLCTAVNDTRVHPMHAWKMAAAMQALNPANPVLLRTRGDAGHGPGKTFYGALSDKAEQLAFIGKVVGLGMKGNDDV
jgi:prolyl oligopeptidase